MRRSNDRRALRSSVQLGIVIISESMIFVLQHASLLQSAASARKLVCVKCPSTQQTNVADLGTEGAPFWASDWVASEQLLFDERIANRMIEETSCQYRFHIR
jgi:hypothetical protein